MNPSLLRTLRQTVKALNEIAQAEEFNSTEFLNHLEVVTTLAREVPQFMLVTPDGRWPRAIQPRSGEPTEDRSKYQTAPDYCGEAPPDDGNRRA
jgi:hypothetical protein